MTDRIRLLAAMSMIILLPMTGWTADFASESHNVLPAGNGNFGQPHSTDQIPLYDGLTPLFDQVTPATYSSMSLIACAPAAPFDRIRSSCSW